MMIYLLTGGILALASVAWVVVLCLAYGLYRGWRKRKEKVC